jgi:hypothetical protein
MKKFLTEYPELISEWHPTKNGELKPEEITHSSKKKVWWLCPKGHDFYSIISNRTTQKTGCQKCKKLDFLFPEISKEWHPSKNGSSRPEEFTHASDKKVWWLCPKDHSYDSRIADRTSKKSGCPYCSGNKVSEENNLKVMFPKIAKEWNPTKNGELKPEDITSGSGKKVWWLCPKDHSYESVISSRTIQKSGCPYCSGHRASNDNNLKLIFPNVASEWNSEKNGSLRPEEFSSRSNRKVWWLCPKGHDYYATIANRTGKKETDCPYCSGNKVSDLNSLLILFPEISKEWHPTKNDDLKVDEVSYGSNKIVWWLCSKGHDYDASIEKRTRIKEPTSCPECSNQSSSPEFRILAEFRSIFDEVKNRHKIEGVEIDVYVPKFNIAIEYDGSYFHQGKEQKDLEKNKFLQKKNIEVFRVRCSPLTKITENDLIVENDDLSKSDLNRIFKKIYSFGDNEIKEKIDEYFDSDNFYNENLFREYLSNLPSPLPEHSLTTNYPDLVNEWDYEKNHPLTPDQFSVGSGSKVWWLCPKDHSYETTIGIRTRNDRSRGCQECKSLEFLFPEIAKEWHPTKNGELKPNEVSYGSKKKVWWLCPKDHDYYSTIKNRTSKKATGCPHCRRNSS